MSKILLFSDRMLALNCDAKEIQQLTGIFNRLKIGGEWSQEDSKLPPTSFKFEKLLISKSFYNALFYCLEDEGFEVFGRYDRAEAESVKTNKPAQLADLLQSACSIINNLNGNFGKFDPSELAFRIDFDEDDDSMVNISLGLAERPDIRFSYSSRFAFIKKEVLIVGKGFTPSSAAADFLRHLASIDPKLISLSAEDDDKLPLDDLFDQFGKVVEFYYSKPEFGVNSPGICLISVRDSEGKTSYRAFGIAEQGVLGFFSPEAGQVEVLIAEHSTPRGALFAYNSEFANRAHSGAKLMVADNFPNFEDICAAASRS